MREGVSLKSLDTVRHLILKTYTLANLGKASQHLERHRVAKERPAYTQKESDRDSLVECVDESGAHRKQTEEEGADGEELGGPYTLADERHGQLERGV